MEVKPISLWDVSTFDTNLIDVLREHAELIRVFHETMKQHAEAYCRLEQDIAECLRDRTIRAFHYSRLICSEVGTLRREGIHLSTQATFYGRLADLARGI